MASARRARCCFDGLYGMVNRGDDLLAPQRGWMMAVRLEG